MNRLFWGIAFLVLAAAGGWAQSTWRGQAEVWAAASAPADGFVAASNQFPRNSLLTVENYKTKKTIQVRVVATLPAESSALVVLNPKAAQALEIKAGEAPMVGVQIDPSGTDLAENPDPDVNPLAAAPAPTSTASAPLLPLPVAAATDAVSEPSAAPAPLAVAEEPDATPLTPGKKVFLTTRNSEPVATESPVVTEPAAGTPTPAASESVPAPEAPPATPAPVASTTPEPTAAVPAPASAPLAPEPTATPAPVAVAPTPATPASVPAVPVAVKPVPAWVSVPSTLGGPVLGQVAVLAGLEKGRPYVQVGAWATEADLLKTLETVKTYVPLAFYKAEGEKNPWRVVASAPKGQLGVLLMLFRAQGFRTAAVVKG